MNIKNISRNLYDISSVIHIIPQISSTLLLLIGGCSLLVLVAIFYFYDYLESVIGYIFVVQLTTVVVYHIYITSLTTRLRKRYDELQMFVERIIDKDL